MAEDDFSSLFDLLPIGAYRSAPDGRQLRANAALVRLNGYASEQQMLASVNDISTGWYVEHDRRGEFRQAMDRYGFVSDFVSEIFRHKTRERIWIREHAHVVRKTDGAVAFYEGTVEDITAQRAAEHEIRGSERRFRALTEKAQVLTLLCDADGIIRYASNAAATILGIAASELLATPFQTLMADDELPLHRAELARVLAFTNSGNEGVIRMRHTDGTWRYLAVLANNELADNAVRGIVYNLRDVTAAHQSEVRLRVLATVDVLTGLHNRHAFEAAAREIFTAERAAADNKAALYFIDLDRFKLVNDSLGHAAGDALLHAIAQRLRNNAPVGALVGRLGGDEFAMLLPQLDSALDVAAIASEVVLTLAAPIEVDNLTLKVTASVGVSVFPDHATSYEQMLRHADLAMLHAKSTRRDSFRVFDAPLAATAQARMTLVDELREAMHARQFEVFYQPQVSLVDGRLSGFEALVRWRHPERGLLGPDAFVSVAEELGLIGEMGRMVAETAVAQVLQWQQVYGQSFTLSLNVSAHQLRDGKFASQLRSILSRHAFASNQLELEITESALVESIERAPTHLHALNDLGVRIVLDDLGVGYSAFSYLKQFQVHGVKLDRGFVSGVPDNAVDSAIVCAIVSLAQSLKLRLVAEGVERPAQRQYLLDQGCEEAQGFLFAKPLATADVEALFHARPHVTGQPLYLLPPE